MPCHENKTKSLENSLSRIKNHVSSRSVSIRNSAFFDLARMRADCHLQVFFIHVSIVFGLAFDLGLTVSQYGFISTHTVFIWFPTRTRQTKSM